MSENETKAVETAEMPEEKKSRIPHIFLLLTIIIFSCVVLTWILPAGEFERAENPATGRMVVVPGTYHEVEKSPVNLFNGLIAIYKGMIDAGSIVFFVFIAYASISIMIQTGVFNGLVAGLLKLLKGNSKAAIIPIFITVIGMASSTIGLFEETLAFIPVFVGISIAMGYDAVVGLAIVALGAGMGYSGAMMNPFTVGVAQGIAELQPMSGAGYRFICHVAMIAVASIYTIRYAMKIQADPTKSVVYGDDFGKLEMHPEELENAQFGIREALVACTFVGGIVAIVYGSKEYGWYFEELCAVFMLMGFISALIMGWGPNTIAKKMAEGFAEIVVAAMMIGLARGILIVMREGNIIDTVVYGMSMPLTALPRWMAAEFMLIFQTALNFLIPSGSGQAATSMPIMAPLADILGVSRQTAVLAFQFGDGLSNVLWPTAFMPAICGIANVRVDKWLKWFVPLFGLLFLTQMVLIAVALVINYQ